MILISLPIGVQTQFVDFALTFIEHLGILRKDISLKKDNKQECKNIPHKSKIYNIEAGFTEKVGNGSIRFVFSINLRKYLT